MLTALPDEQMDHVAVGTLLGVLGAESAAARLVANVFARGDYVAPSWLFYPSMAGALRDPGFPAVAQHLGLMHYWKATHTKPDVCTDKNPPPFCRMI
jgi:hypothetical protein